MRVGGRFFLAFSWIAGLICGVWFFLAADNYSVALMRGCHHSAVSIVCLLAFTALPFLLSIFMAFTSKPALILLVCFCRAFLFSFVSFGIIQCYGSSAWLLRNLLLFHDCAAIPILYFFWLRGMSDTRFFYSLEAFLLLSLSTLIGSIDYSIISPFAAYLIDFQKG